MYLINKLSASFHKNLLERQRQLLSFHRRYERFTLRRSSTTSPQSGSEVQNKENHEGVNHAVAEEVGGMSRRLAQMTDGILDHGGRSAEKAIEEAGFSEELKRQLEERIKDGKFKSDHSAAIVQLNTPVSIALYSKSTALTAAQPSAGQGTRDIATAQPWTGVETVEDSVLRMLTDAKKPLRITTASKTPIPRGSALSVDMRMKKAVQKSRGQRLANARDRTSVYALTQDPNLSEHEKEQMRKQLKERFTPSARSMPGTVQGLAALANERIEDAISRGQFKNIPRGKGKNIERDYTASSPFLDTTEYFMNKIIQKQEIVPPWIEKQQELVRAAAVFRSRLRADWKRHAARTIASKGGLLETQIARAEANAAAEAAINPRTRKIEKITKISKDGRVSQIAIDATPAPSPKPEVTNTITKPPDSNPDTDIQSATTNPQPATNTKEEPTPNTAPPPPLPNPFRDPKWEALERGYHALAITSLNNLTRSYNLQAPQLAEKPYFSLARELAACYADIAPLLPAEIRARATTPTAHPEAAHLWAQRSGGWRGLSGAGGVRVVDSTKPHYGFRQFWRDFWGRG